MSERVDKKKSHKWAVRVTCMAVLVICGQLGVGMWLTPNDIFLDAGHCL